MNHEDHDERTPQYHKTHNAMASDRDKPDSGLLQALDSLDEGVRSYSNRINELHDKLARILLVEEPHPSVDSAHASSGGSSLQDTVWDLSHRIANCNIELVILMERIDL